MFKYLFLLSTILFSFHFAKASVVKECSVIAAIDTSKMLEKANKPLEEKAFKILEGGSVAMIITTIAMAVITSSANKNSESESPEFTLYIVILGALGVGVLSLINKLVARKRAAKKEKYNNNRETLAKRFFARQFALILLAAALLLWSNIVAIIPIAVFGAVYGLAGFIGTQISLNIEKNKKKNL